MSISIWRDRSRRNQQVWRGDFTVIGGGIAGLSTCWWLEKTFPGMKIALVEKMELAAGASGRNAGFVTCGSVEHFNRLVETRGQDEALMLWNFGEENRRLLEEHVVQDCREKIGFERKGSFSLASEAGEFNELKTSASLMEKMGIQVEVLEHADLIGRLGCQGFAGGIKYLDDASVDPVALIELMRSQLKKTEIFEGHEVFELNHYSDRAEAKTQWRQFESEAIVMALNGYAPLLHPYFKDIIAPTRGQILATTAVPHFMEGPCYANFVLDYFRQLPSGEVVIGGFRQLQKDAEIGYSDETSDLIQTALEEFLHKHLPQLKEAKISHRWSGVMGFSGDGWPLLGSLPGEERFFFLGGFTAHGMGLAFHSAKMLVDAMNGEEIPKVFNARRFAK